MGRYTRTPILRNATGTQYYKRVIYPEIPRSNQDIYVITTEGDRYDILALRYYNSASLWWVISTANPEYVGASLVPAIGVQIRIPFPINPIINSYNELNK